MQGEADKKKKCIFVKNKNKKNLTKALQIGKAYGGFGYRNEV